MKRTVKLPIGIENFEKMRTEGFYYVNKTGLITELLNTDRMSPGGEGKYLHRTEQF